MMKGLISDAFLLAGAVSIGYGLWQYSPPSAFIFGGFLSMGYGVLLGRRE